jgi:hypothetical protein
MLPPLLLSNPASLYVGFGLLALLLLMVLVYSCRHLLRRRKAAVRERSDAHSQGASPAQDLAAADASAAIQAPPFAVGESLGARIVKGALILLAWIVAGGFLLVVLPESTVEKWAQAIRWRAQPAASQEPIAFLYLGDEILGQEFHIRGVIRNIAAHPIEKIDATLRLYAADGKLIETVVVRMDTEVLAPDATSVFHLSFPEYAGQFSSYSVDFKTRDGESVPYKDMRGARERS